MDWAHKLCAVSTFRSHHFLKETGLRSSSLSVQIKVLPVFSRQSLDSKEIFFLNLAIEKLLCRFFLRQNAIVEYTVAMFPQSPCHLKEFQNK
jgi:hypothetical protein